MCFITFFHSPIPISADPEGTGILFFDFYRILRSVEVSNRGRHVFWLFENVASMPVEYRKVISRYVPPGRDTGLGTVRPVSPRGRGDTLVYVHGVMSALRRSCNSLAVLGLVEKFARNLLFSSFIHLCRFEGSMSFHKIT